MRFLRLFMLARPVILCLLATLLLWAVVDLPSTAKGLGAIGGSETPARTEPMTSIMADLAVNHMVQVEAMSDFTFTTVVESLGPNAAHGAILSLTLPSMLISPAWTCSASGGADCAPLSGSGLLTGTLDVFPVGGVITYTITGSAVPPGRMESTAQIMPPVGIVDPVLENNRATAVHDVVFLPTAFVSLRSTPGPTTLISRSYDGSPSQGGSSDPSISYDGRYIVYESYSWDLVADDDNGEMDVFMHDRVSNETTLVSRSPSGVPGNGRSDDGLISSDGSVVAFRSEATNLTENDRGGNLYIWELANRIVINLPITVDDFGMSADGRYLAFVREQSVGLYDRSTDTVDTLFDCEVSVSDPICTQRLTVNNPTVSPDGRMIAYEYGLPWEQPHEGLIVDRALGEKRQVGVGIAMSPDWQFVAYSVDGLIYMDNLKSNETTPVSVTYYGQQAQGVEPSVSKEGRYVAFSSRHSSIVPDDRPGSQDLFVFDRSRRKTLRISVSPTGEPANFSSEKPAISGDGSIVVFSSLADNLTSDPTDGGGSRIYLHEPNYPLLDSMPTAFDCTAMEDVPQSDCEALVSIHASLLQRSWMEAPIFPHSWAWLYGTAVCDWEGLTCSGSSTDRSVTAFHSWDVAVFPDNSSQYVQIGLNGSIPPEIGQLTSLKTLDIFWEYSDYRQHSLATREADSTAMVHNLTGGIPEAIGDLDQLETLILSSANLTGVIPIGAVTSPALRELDLSKNLLQGTIPQELGQQGSVERVDFSHNQLTGTLPLDMTGAPSLKTLDLSNNQLTGTLPASFATLSSLRVLDLSHNQLQGSLPDMLFDVDIGVLNLSHNQFSGEVPQWQELFNQAYRIHLSHNQFTGVIPQDLSITNPYPRDYPPSYLDLSYNAFQGPIPPNLSAQSELILAHNEFTGTIPSSLAQGQDVSILDLSYNRLTGEIPSSLGALTNLEVLNVAHNLLSGTLPSDLGNLWRLDVLDLSGNPGLTGPIPLSFANLVLLDEFHFEETDLCIPPDSVIQTWLQGIETVTGTGLLCGAE